MIYTENLRPLKRMLISIEQYNTAHPLFSQLTWFVLGDRKPRQIERIACLKVCMFNHFELLWRAWFPQIDLHNITKHRGAALAGMHQFFGNRALNMTRAPISRVDAVTLPLYTLTLVAGGSQYHFSSRWLEHACSHIT